jgi:hypothetical protein
VLHTDYLGWKVKDNLTGLVGIVNSIIERMEGTQIDVQPKGDGTKVETGWYMDPHTCSKQGYKRAIEPQTAIANVANVGDEAEDTVTGFKGTVTESILYLNGCRKYTIVGKAKVKGEEENASSGVFSAQRIKVTKAVKPSVVKTPKPKTGGPMVRAHR